MGGFLKNHLHRILNAAEKLFRVDVRYVLAGNFWLTLNRLIGVGSGLLLSIAFANLLPKEAFGTYKYVLSIAGILTAFTLSGLGTAITRSAAKNLSGFVYDAYWTAVRWSLIGSSFAFLGGAYYFYKHNVVLGSALVFIALAHPVLNSCGHIMRIFEGKRNFAAGVKFGVPRNIVATVALVTTVLLTTNVIIIVFAYFLTSAILSFVGFLYTIKYYKINLGERNKVASKETIAYAKHMSLIGLCTYAASELDKLLLWHFAGPAALATYAFALTPVKETRALTENVFPLALPKFANRSLEEIAQGLPRRMLQMLLVTLPIVAIYILLSPYLFQFLFPKYLDAVFYSQLLILTLLFQPKGLINTAFLAHAKVKQQYAVTIFDTVVRMCLYVLFIPFFGILGIIFALLLSEVANGVLLYIFLQRIRKSP